MTARSLETTRSSTASSHISWIARSSRWAFGIVVLSVGSAASVGCAAPATTQTGDDEIIGGVRDDDTTHSNVVALRVGDESAFELCSGAVLAPNVVLTARHCVAVSRTDAIACDENGRPAGDPEHISGNQPASNIAVFVGATPSFRREPAAVAKEIIAPSGSSLCNSDIAIIVLDKDLTGVLPFAVRRTASARVGETIRAVGYGRNDQKTPMGTRFRKEKVPVLAVGSTVTESKTPLGSNEFEVGRSICEGDSGGPAISELTGAVIGVVSRGGPCGNDFGHVYTSTAGFDELFERAFASKSTSKGATLLVEKNTPPPTVAPPSPEPSEDESPSGPGAAASGCGVTTSGVARPQGTAAAGLALGLALLSRLRRRRTASRSH